MARHSGLSATPISCRLLAVTLAAIFPLAAAAQSGGLHLEAKEIGSSGRKQILLTFRDPSGKAGPVDAQVYFVARASDEGTRFIYAHSELSVNFRGATHAEAKVDIPEVKPKPEKRPPVGFAYTFSGFGNREGWLLLAKVNGRALPPRASSGELLEIARTREFLAPLIATYEKPAAPPSRP